MTPKEKAIQLFDEFLFKVGTNCENDSYCDRKECQYKNRTVCGVDLFTAKQCALIAVAEILKITWVDKFLTVNEYWQEVKQEIEKL